MCSPPSPVADTDLTDLLGRLSPERRPGSYVFVTVAGPPAATLDPVMVFTEDEGTTLILATPEADAAGLRYTLVTAWITLTVQSALDAVGLTAAVSGALAEVGISCNVVAGAFHDHLFVPLASADDAVRVLAELSARSQVCDPSRASGSVRDEGE